MIIDFHVHTAFYETKTESYINLLKDSYGDRLDWLIKTYSSPEAFLGLMDEAGIDYAVVLAELAPITTGIVDNDYVAGSPVQASTPIPSPDRTRSSKGWSVITVFKGSSFTPRTSFTTPMIQRSIRSTQRPRNWRYPYRFT
jgi:hypothetical protein